MSEPLDQLAAFYKSLDDIPTPLLAPRRMDFVDYAKLAFAPLAAAFVSYAYLAFCAYGPADAKQIAPISLSIDHYALIELKPAPPEQNPNEHTSREIATWRVI